MTRGPNQAPSYRIRVRTRAFHEHTILGGDKIGAHRRRVERWSSWKSHRFAPTAASALRQLEDVKKQNPLADVGVFHERMRLTIEQLRARAAKEAS